MKDIFSAALALIVSLIFAVAAFILLENQYYEGCFSDIVYAGTFLIFLLLLCSAYISMLELNECIKVHKKDKDKLL